MNIFLKLFFLLAIFAPQFSLAEKSATDTSADNGFVYDTSRISGVQLEGSALQTSSHFEDSKQNPANTICNAEFVSADTPTGPGIELETANMRISEKSNRDNSRYSWSPITTIDVTTSRTRTFDFTLKKTRCPN